jgi:hypothetical protein
MDIVPGSTMSMGSVRVQSPKSWLSLRDHGPPVLPEFRERLALAIVCRYAEIFARYYRNPSGKALVIHARDAPAVP